MLAINLTSKSIKLDNIPKASEGCKLTDITRIVELKPTDYMLVNKAVKKCSTPTAKARIIQASNEITQVVMNALPYCEIDYNCPSRYLCVVIIDCKPSLFEFLRPQFDVLNIYPVNL